MEHCCGFRLDASLDTPIATSPNHVPRACAQVKRLWISALAPIVVIAAGVAAAQLRVLPWISPAAQPDFPPFVMSIEEWDKTRVTYQDGVTLGGTSVYRLEYDRRDNWKLTLVSDELERVSPGRPVIGAMAPGQGNACRDGAYGAISTDGTFRVTSNEAGMCNGVPRWVRPGMACCYSWDRSVANGVITYTSPGERITFNEQTRLPLVYEAGPVNGPVGHRTTYRLERWLSTSRSLAGGEVRLMAAFSAHDLSIEVR